ncbi:signal peptide, secreted low complexity protein [Cryptosporidium felis]|nr:signal peptide, secreted low complexity protein [Cryptosporidium felis]
MIESQLLVSQLKYLVNLIGVMAPPFFLRSSILFSFLILVITGFIEGSVQSSECNSRNYNASEIPGESNLCRELFDCDELENNRSGNSVTGICGNCLERQLTSECLSVPLINDSFQLLSFTNGFDIDVFSTSAPNEIDILNNTYYQNQSKLIFSGTFEEVNGIENCLIDKNNNIEILREVYIVYNQLDENEISLFNVHLRNPIQKSSNQSIEVVRNWLVDIKLKNHILYIYKIYRRALEDKVEYSSGLENGSSIFTDILSSIIISLDSRNTVISKLFQPCIRISCLKKKTTKIRFDVNENKGTAINNIIRSINYLKSSARSKEEYIMNIKVFVKTLLKSLKRKVNRNHISAGCTIKMINWIMDLCEKLGIQINYGSNFGKLLSEFKTSVERYSKSPMSSIPTSNEKSHNRVEATEQDYEILENKLFNC